MYMYFFFKFLSGYITTCPTRYVAEDIANEFKKNIKNIYNRKNTEKAESFYNFSTSDEDKSTISSTTSSASSLNLSKKGGHIFTFK